MFWLIVFAVLLLLVVGTVRFLVPSWLERKLNATLIPPPYTASDRAHTLHRTLFVADLHADSLLWDRDLLKRSTRGHVDIPRLIEGHVALQAFTIVTKSPRNYHVDRTSGDSDLITSLAIGERWPIRTWGSLLQRALYQASKLDDVARRSGGRFTVLRTSADLSAYLERRTRTADITAGFLGVEGGHALDGNPDNVDRLFDAGVRMMAPTHLFDNDISGSAHGIEKGGLTDKGKAMLRRLEARRMLLDLAHASPRTIEDALALATRPLIVSHTGVKGTCDNARNLSDDHLRRISATGGVIGIGYWGEASGGTDVQSIVRAIRHAVHVAGIDHVGLGSDFDGAVHTPFDTTGVVLITDALLQDGFSESEIRKIMGGNVLRLLRATLP